MQDRQAGGRREKEEALPHAHGLTSRQNHTSVSLNDHNTAVEKGASPPDPIPITRARHGDRQGRLPEGETGDDEEATPEMQNTIISYKTLHYAF